MEHTIATKRRLPLAPPLPGEKWRGWVDLWPGRDPHLPPRFCAIALPDAEVPEPGPYLTFSPLWPTVAVFFQSRPEDPGDWLPADDHTVGFIYAAAIRAGFGTAGVRNYLVQRDRQSYLIWVEPGAELPANLPPRFCDHHWNTNAAGARWTWDREQKLATRMTHAQASALVATFELHHDGHVHLLKRLVKTSKSTSSPATSA